jgi:hypothetical protein
MSPFWRAFFGAALGKLFINLALALCIALGFGGPTDWVAFMIAGMPTFVTPGIARLSLLLAASLGVFFEWRVPVYAKIIEWKQSRRRAAKIAFIMICCSPFVVGAFYITAKGEPARHLSHSTKITLERELQKIPRTTLTHIAVASIDDPEATSYA